MNSFRHRETTATATATATTLTVKKTKQNKILTEPTGSSGGSGGGNGGNSIMNSVARGQQQVDSIIHGNDTAASGGRWRIETSTGGGGGSGGNLNSNSQLETYSRLLLDRADPINNGIYECEVVTGGADPASGNLLADHGHPQRGGGGIASSLPVTPIGGGEQLRRLFGLVVNGK